MPARLSIFKAHRHKSSTRDLCYPTIIDSICLYDQTYKYELIKDNVTNLDYPRLTLVAIKYLSSLYIIIRFKLIGL
jgi:hypothetical protein